MNIHEDAIRDFWIKNPKASMAQVSRSVGCSMSTVKRYRHLKPVFEPVSQKEIVKSTLEKKIQKDIEKQNTFWEVLKDDFLDCVKPIEPPMVEIPGLTTREVFDPEHICILLSDMHTGQVVDASDIANIGEYNVEILRKRMEYYFKSLIKILQIQVRNTPCPEIDIFIIGDMTEGLNIFRGQPMRVEMGVGKQVMEAANILSGFLGQIAILNDWRVAIIVVPGNHGRIGKKGEFGPTDNFDFILGHFIKERLEKFKNVQVLVSERYFELIEINGHVFHLSHGDNMRAWMGIPYYAFDRALGRYTRVYAENGQVFPKYFISGHIHQSSFLGSRVTNGSWVGPNDYSLNSLQSATPPSQVVFGLHENHGITWYRALHLISPHEAPRAEVRKLDWPK